MELSLVTLQAPYGTPTSETGTCSSSLTTSAGYVPSPLQLGDRRGALGVCYPEGMGVPQRASWTQDEFFSWASTQEGRYEFDGFRPVSMTGGTVEHETVVQNLFGALRPRLRGGRCARTSAPTRAGAGWFGRKLDQWLRVGTQSPRGSSRRCRSRSRAFALQQATAAVHARLARLWSCRI
jgi:hypothetical protein